MAEKVVVEVCHTCTDTFVAHLGENYKTPNYCSDNCRNKGIESQYNANKVTCDNCGEKFKRKPSHEMDNNYCSQSCMGESRSERYSGSDNPNYQGGKSTTISKCGYCGDYFTHRVYRPGNYCSRQCFGYSSSGEDAPRWKGGKPSYYGPNWRQQRRKRIQKDNESCCYCGMTRKEHYNEWDEDLHVHHINPILDFKVDGEFDFDSANSISNLSTICRDCHYDWEGVPLRPQ